MEKIIGQVVCIEDKKIEDSVLVTNKIRVTIEVDTDFVWIGLSLLVLVTSIFIIPPMIKYVVAPFLGFLLVVYIIRKLGGISDGKN